MDINSGAGAIPLHFFIYSQMSLICIIPYLSNFYWCTISTYIGNISTNKFENARKSSKKREYRIFGVLHRFASRNYDYQFVVIPTERSEGGSQSKAPLPVAGGGALLCVQRSVNDAGVHTKEITGHRKRCDGSCARSATLRFVAPLTFK